MTDTEILEDLKKHIEVAIQSSQNQLEVLVKLSGTIEGLVDRMNSLEARLLVLENRMNQ